MTTSTQHVVGIAYWRRLRELQERAERQSIIAAAFAESGRIGQAHTWAAKADATWRQWIAAKETD